MVSYGGSSSVRPIAGDRGVGLSGSGVCHLCSLETSSDKSVVKWLNGTEIADTRDSVSLPKLTQKVHLRKTNPKLVKSAHRSRQSLKKITSVYHGNMIQNTTVQRALKRQ